ncbi:hypothetical protein EZI45_15955 [Delftia tsuruhatensis]|nr:MAG: hypothetical protein DI604_04255 [Delftia acidovorans]TDF27556.1 hypothetical protein EZI45_15955 [Delftia tsuruhatensis]
MNPLSRCAASPSLLASRGRGTAPSPRGGSCSAPLALGRVRLRGHGRSGRLGFRGKFRPGATDMAARLHCGPFIQGAGRGRFLLPVFPRDSRHVQRRPRSHRPARRACPDARGAGGA